MSARPKWIDRNFKLSYTYNLYLSVNYAKNNENKNVLYLCYRLTECKVVLQSSYY